MNADELKTFVESRGYDHVNVTVFKESFWVSYWSPEYKNQRKCRRRISELPNKFDGSKLAWWLETSFPSIVTEEKAKE